MLEYLVLRLLYSKVVIQYTWLGVVCADVGSSKIVIQYTWLEVVCADVGISSSKVVIL